MTTSREAPQPRLDALREEIDRIDRNLHAALIERGEIIDRLISVKAAQPGASAFRPAREADMMRRLVGRHRGMLPLAAVESIWRVIISTFTYVQAPYTVHADVSAGDPPMRDSARFHFGFTVPLETHDGPDRVIAAVAAAEGDLGLLRADTAVSAWWEALTAPDAPKIIARLPFVERADNPVSVPLFIVAKPLGDGASREVMLYAVEASSRPHAGGPIDVILAHGDRFVVAAAQSVPFDAVVAAVRPPGVRPPRVVPIGSHAARFEVDTLPQPASR